MVIITLNYIVSLLLRSVKW